MVDHASKDNKQRNHSKAREPVTGQAEGPAAKDPPERFSRREGHTARTSMLAAWRVRRRRGGDEQVVAWEATSLPRGAQTDDG